MHPMRPLSRAVAPLFAVLLAVMGNATAALAQDRAGVFDHYVLAMSWIPAYCADDGDDRADPRCAEGRRIGWAVHGLWPQHDGGDWPEFCLTGERNPSRRETGDEADLFGTSGAAWHQWNKHGRCSGLSAPGYYALVRRAVAAIELPEVFDGITRELRVDPDVVEAAFIEANPELTNAMLVTACQRGDLVEIRLCLTRDLEPRACDAEMIRRECRLNAATLLPLR